MSRHDLQLLDLAFKALEPRQPKPANLRAYQSMPAVDYPCYECGEEATHEIMHRGAPLDVCDTCDLSAGNA